MTFELHLEPQTPAYLAERLIGTERSTAIEQLEPSHFAG